MFSIEHSIEIEADASLVFDAITKPEGLSSWWTAKSSGKLAIGEQYNFYFTPDFDWWAVVVAFEENESVEFVMTDADEDWMSTRLVFSISVTGVNLLLTLEHEDWKSQNEHFYRTKDCWKDYLENLKKYIEKGEPTIYGN